MAYLGEKNYLPKLNHSTIKFLKQHIKPETIILETGSGNSTIWMAKRAKRVVSLENNASWLKQVKQHLKKEKLNNVRIYLDQEYYLRPLERTLYERDTMQYDIVLHDGPNVKFGRTLIAKELPNITKGLLVLDDTHNKNQYLPSLLKYLDNLNSKKIVFPLEEDAWGGKKEAIVYDYRR